MAIRTGIVGFGISAKVFHAPFISTIPDFELVSILERSKSESKELYPGVKIVRTIEEMVTDPTIELVVITTPNDTHFPYTKLALEAGKHVVLEKPFANNSEEAKELVELAARTGNMLSVYQNRRYVSDFRTIKQVLDQKLLGDIHTYEAHYHRFRAEERPQAWREKPEPGSGILFDLGAHLIDQALNLFGWPTTVTADVRLQRPHAKTDDYFDLRLDYGFLRVRLSSGMLVREPGPRYLIHGTKGSFLKSGEDVQEAQLRAGAVRVSKNWGAEPESMYGTLHTEKDGEVISEIYPSLPGNYGDYYRSVYQTLKQGEPLSETPQHGYNTIRIIEAAFESSKRKTTIEV